MIYKILHKLGLGETAYKVLKPFTKRKCELPSLQEALELLSSIDADAGQSCITQEALPPESGMALDVIIPAYNASKYIANAVHSALEQENIPEGELEVIVINDCSPDDIDTAMKPFSEDEAAIYIRNEHNLGVAETRNRGIRMARGQYVAFLDADDWWEPDKLAAQIRLLEEEE